MLSHSSPPISIITLRWNLREHEPGDGRGARHVPEADAADVDARGRDREGRLRGLAARPGAEARRDPLPLRADARAREGGAHRPDDARDGEGQGRGRRRRPGSDRHDVLHGRRRPPPVGPDDAVRAPEQVQHVRARAGRRRRRDHAVELPDRDPVVEARARARLRQHRRAEAGGGHAAPRAALRRAARRGGLPDGVVNIVHGYGETAGEALVRHPRRARDHLHRLARDRRRGDEGRGRPPQARPPRARRQERDHRARRRRPRPRGRGHRLVGVRHVRPALHRRVARDRARGGLRRAAVAARRARRADAPRAGLGGRHRRRPGDQPRRDREDPLVHEDRPGRGRAAADRRRDRDRRRPRQGLLLPADDLRRRRRRRCASRRRRSSGRRPR